MTTSQHHDEASRGDPARCAVLTISDTRTSETDESGPAIRAAVEENGHEIVRVAIVPDDPATIRSKLAEWLANDEIEVILSTGGTGIAKRDNTVNIVRELLTEELDGFGELFRMLSWHEVGSAALLSRALGGLVRYDANTGGDTFIFAMPGSVNAVTTAMTKLIAPELGHLVWQRRA